MGRGISHETLGLAKASLVYEVGKHKASFQFAPGRAWCGLLDTSVLCMGQNMQESVQSGAFVCFMTAEDISLYFCKIL